VSKLDELAARTHQRLFDLLEFWDLQAKLDMLRIEDTVDERANDNQRFFEACGVETQPAPLQESCEEFWALVDRIDRIQSAEQPGDCSQEDDDYLWRARAELTQRILDAAAPTIPDINLKIAVMGFRLTEGELRVALTPQCLEDCDRALARETHEDECLKTLEPDLWSACLRLREQIAELRGALAAEGDPVNSAAHSGGAWWTELRASMTAVVRHESRTRVGLRAKGQIFVDLLEFASLLDGLGALQQSYLNDFEWLAH
jgi:hypothetical protein